MESSNAISRSVQQWRRLRAVDLKEQGWSQRKIALHLGEQISRIIDYLLPVTTAATLS